MTDFIVFGSGEARLVIFGALVALWVVVAVVRGISNLLSRPDAS